MIFSGAPFDPKRVRPFGGSESGAGRTREGRMAMMFARNGQKGIHVYRRESSVSRQQSPGQPGPSVAGIFVTFLARDLQHDG